MVVRGRGDDGPRHDAVLEDLAGTVGVGQECFEGQDALADTGLDGRPLRRRDDAGNDVEGEGTLLATDVDTGCVGMNHPQPSVT